MRRIEKNDHLPDAATESYADPPTVNSWNEWDDLKEIVVGRADSACFDPTEPAFKPKIRGVNPEERQPFPHGPKPIEVIDRANDQLDALVAVLEKEGVVVRRPDVLPLSEPIHVPMFDVENQYCVVCPRDVMITVGHEIIEATMSRRARYFEHLAYRRLVYQYWQLDPAVSWTAAPRPSMADSMYREEFWQIAEEERYARMHEFEFCVTQDEVIFDAADICRMGQDILVQESMTTNRLGIMWLKRHLEPRGLRVHAVHFPLDRYPSHIDCTFVPLRPGLILTNPDRPLAKGESKLFLDNGWELLDAPRPISSNEKMPPYCQSSMWLSMNVLSISPTKILVEEQEAPLQRLLTKRGFDVITVPFRSVYEFGGSLHCATWDVYREGTCDSYFDQVQP